MRDLYTDVDYIRVQSAGGASSTTWRIERGTDSTVVVRQEGTTLVLTVGPPLVAVVPAHCPSTHEQNGLQWSCALTGPHDVHAAATVGITWRDA
jgi:hypothetical protein